MKPNHHAGRAIALGVLVICFIIAGWILFNRQYIVDQLMVWQYQPTREVESIATRAKLSDHGQFYFYASQPQVDEADVFNQQCRKQEEHSAILGCYSARRIYIYNVSNDKLEGIKEVTAAHEMLHAAWDRLSPQEKKHLEPLLEKVYSRVATTELRDRMAYYERTQPGEKYNELHSIIGTEVSGVGSDLEQYYAQYFTDRQQVTSMHQRYESVFTQLKLEADSLVTQLTSLAAEIDQQTVAYNAAVTQLNADISSFNDRATQTGGFSSQAAFNAERSRLLTASGDLEAQRAAINDMITRYNQLRTELEAINAQSAALTQSIDSTLAPAPSI